VGLLFGFSPDGIGSCFSSFFNETGWPMRGRDKETSDPSMDVPWFFPIAFLIFLMQGGFTFAEIGILRPQNTENVILKNLTGFALASLGFFFVGYGLMFGESAWGLWGSSDFSPDALHFLEILENEILADRMVQMALAVTVIPIVTGVMIERTKFLGYLILAVLMGTFLYPIVGHWIWGGGWLARLGMIDMAGATGVFSLAGWVALAATLVLGRRPDVRRPAPFPCAIHNNLSIVALGVFLLWFGWFGFNTGQILLVNGSGIALTSINTVLAGCSGALSSLAVSRFGKRRLDVPGTLGGALCGLVASSGGSSIVNPLSIIVIGGCAGIFLHLSLFLLGRLRIDDPVGSLSIYGASGLWGTLAVGFFAESPYTQKYAGYAADGLFYGGGADLLWVQMLGMGAVFLFAFPLSFGILNCWIDS
jgi:ammonium transporter, Amt family